MSLGFITEISKEEADYVCGGTFSDVFVLGFVATAFLGTAIYVLSNRDGWQHQKERDDAMVAAYFAGGWNDGDSFSI